MEDDVLCSVVEAVIFDGAFADAADELVAVGAVEVEDAADVEEGFEELGLLEVAWDAVEDDVVNIWFEEFGFDEAFDALAPEFNGELVWDELAAA